MPTIDFVHDFLCPWCRVGAHYLEQALAEWKGPAPTVRVHPYLLSPDTAEGGADRRAYLAAKYGADRVAQMDARLEQLGKDIGLPFNLEKMNRLPSTVRAHAMIAAVPVEKQWPLLRAIEEAYFSQGKDISDPQVLTQLGESVGLTPDEARTAALDGDREAARQEAEEAREGGITGVPTFIFDRRLPLVGAQPPEVLLRALTRVSSS